MINEIDKVGGFLESNEYYCISPKSNDYNKHVSLKRANGGVWLTATSKLWLQKDSLHGITKDNIEYYKEELANKKGLVTTTEALLNMSVQWIDVKKDVLIKNEPPKMLSYLRELAYLSTLKNEVFPYGENGIIPYKENDFVSYEKDLGFENSLLIKSSCKTVNDSLCIYNKTYEMYVHRSDDIEYYNNFSSAFLEGNKNLLRFERRLQSGKAIKKALKWSKKGKVRLIDVFECPTNIVGDKVRQIFKIEEQKYEN